MKRKAKRLLNNSETKERDERKSVEFNTVQQAFRSFKTVVSAPLLSRSPDRLGADTDSLIGPPETGCLFSTWGSFITRVAPSLEVREAKGRGVLGVRKGERGRSGMGGP